MVALIGAILGTLVTNDYFTDKSISFLVSVTAFLFTLVGALNFLRVDTALGVMLLFVASYLSGKANPKLDALLMASLPSDTLAQSNSLLTLLFACSVPVGTMVFSSLAAYSLPLCWLVLGGVAFLSLILASRK